jgi:spermidine synthase
LNTVGAAVGSLLCGFVLISSMGVWGTLFVAIGINFVVGSLCILLAKHRELSGPEVPARRDDKDTVDVMIPPNTGVTADVRDQAIPWALCIFAVSGFCSMAYEVIWIRLLGLIIGPTTYSFTLVVSTFIIGLAAGSIIFGWLGDRTRKVFLLLGTTQLCASWIALGVSHFLGNSQFFFSKLILTFQEDFGTLVLAQSIVLFIILVGPTIFLGATFPLVNRIYARSIPMLGKSIGTAYALNTLGAVLGSFVAGFILIPLLGKESGLKLVAMLQFVVALMALMLFRLKTQKTISQWLIGMAIGILGLILVSNFPSWNRQILSQGWYRGIDGIKGHLSQTSWVEAIRFGPMKLAEEKMGVEVVFYGDGIGGFTTVEKETTSIGIDRYVMLNSGKPDASSHGDRSTQTLLAHIPLLFHQNPEKVMVLGLASGMTPGEVLLYPVKQLDVLEISDQVVRACELFFASWNNACLSDPRTRIILQDGRNHLALTHEEYDVIISEPSNPWMAGLANLYTLEFFQLVKGRLREKGIFAQWIHSYEMDWDTFALVGRTFKEVFPNGLLMKTDQADYLLLGFSEQSGLDWKIAEKNVKYARDSSNVSLRNPGFLVHLIVTEDLSEFFESGLLHTDNRPHLEFAAPKHLYDRGVVLDGTDVERLWLSPQTQRTIQANSNTDSFLDLFEFAASAYSTLVGMVRFEGLTPSQKDRYDKIVKRFCEEFVIPTYEMLPDRESIEGCAKIHIGKIRQQLATNNSRAADHYNLSLAHLAAGQIEETIQELQETVSLDPFHPDAHTNLGLLLAETERLEDALGHFAKVIEINPRDAEAYKNLGVAQFQVGELEQAFSHFSKAVELVPGDVDAIIKLGAVLLEQGRLEEAIENFLTALGKNPESVEAHSNLGVAFYQQGDMAEARKHFLAALQIDPQNQDVRHNLDMIPKHVKNPHTTSKKP